MKENQNQLAAMQQNANVATFNFFDPVQFGTMQRVCNLFAYSELVPDMYKVVLTPVPANATDAQIAEISAKNQLAEKKAIANCMIAVSMAMRINADPLMVMQNMIIIYGRPSWSSKFLIATVNTCGRFEPLQYHFEVNGKIGKVKYIDYVYNPATRRKESSLKEFDGSEVDNLTCYAFTTKKGSSDILKSSVIDLRLAVVEGWYTKSGSKWKTMPEQMLRYRAASMWTSVYAPEISMGMRTVEEQQDIVDTDFEEIRKDGVDARVALEKENNANGKILDMGAAPEAKQQPENQPESKPEKKEEAAKPANEPSVSGEEKKPNW